MLAVLDESLKRYRRRALGLYLAVLLCIAAILAGFQWRDYDRQIQAGWERALARADLAVEWADTAFMGSDMALAGLVELVEAPWLDTLGDTVDSSYEQLEALLQQRSQALRFLDELGLFDRAGNVVVTSSPVFPAGYNLQGLPHFQAFQVESPPQEWISPLYWSAFTSSYHIMHARRLQGGRLEGGLAVLRLRPQIFEEGMERLALLPGESLSLLDTSMRLVARQPCEPPGSCIGMLLDAPWVVDFLAQEVPRGQARLVSPVDGVDRLFVFQRVEGRPFVVAAGESVEALLAGWWEELWLRVGVWLVLALLASALLRHYLLGLSLEREARIAATAFDSQQGMFITDADSRILKVNSAFTRTTGYAEQEVAGRTPSLWASGHHDAAFYRHMWQSLTQFGNWEGDIWNRRRNGEVYPQRLTINAVRDVKGAVTHFVAAFSDISREKAAEDEARQLASFDPLTGLPNRRRLIDRLNDVRRGQGKVNHYEALMLLDLDHFKQVNDLLGHPVGDQLLQQISGELKALLRENDTLARLSGDEFAVLLEGLGPDLDHAVYITERIAQKLQCALQVTVPSDAYALLVTASIGITLFRRQQGEAQLLLQQADLALRQAKQTGRNRHVFFNPDMQKRLSHRSRLEADLRLALPAGQLRLHYQPQFHVEGRMIGAEALLRWQHPVLGMVSPAEFIPLAEESRLIIAIDEWVLEEACHVLAAWAKHPKTIDLVLSVNISAQQFHEPGFVERVMAMLDRSGAPPHRLKLEITEGIFLERQDAARDTMLALKAQGVAFALDDFGTGYSSLSYLNRLPLDQLKIDQSFVRHLMDDKASAAIVESTIALSHSLHLEVVAEGVETEAQKAWLASHGCTIFQGYLFGRPGPLEFLPLEDMASAR